MNKQEAKLAIEIEKQLIQISNERIVAAQKILDSVDSVLSPGFYFLSASHNQKLLSYEGTGGKHPFQSRELAENYAKAFNTFLKLRHQAGTVPSTLSPQYIIEWNFSEEGELIVVSSDLFYKFNTWSPCFEDKEAAEKAIEVITKDRIIHMVKTFSHYAE